MELSQNKINKLANKFSTLLGQYLTPEQLTTINIENNTRNNNSCATHDYIDSNEVMNEAFKSLFNIDIEVQNETHVELINKAWDLAKYSNFNISGDKAYTTEDYKEYINKTIIDEGVKENMLNNIHNPSIRFILNAKLKAENKQLVRPLMR